MKSDFTDTILYPRLRSGETQSMFDLRFRLSQGLDPEGTTWLNIDGYDPSDLSIEFLALMNFLVEEVH